ncbi:MAG: hypothetical protein ACREB6_11270, partial [Rhodospirillales bacterium]
MPRKISLVSRSMVPGIGWPLVPATGDRRQIILSLIGQFEESELLPEQEIRARQLRQLGRLLAHARATVP